MPNFNSGYYFNSDAKDGGFFWNGADYVILLNINETLSVADGLSFKLAKLVLMDKFSVVYDEILQTAFYNRDIETFYADDSVTYSTLFELLDSFGIKDAVSDLIVLSFLHEKMNFIEEFKQFAKAIVIDDIINVKDISTVDALLSTIDSFGLEDLFGGIQFVLNMYDNFGMTDKEPKTAISDFIIGNSDNYDTAYDWFLPFGMKIDWNNTVIQVSPEAAVDEIIMPGIDGSIVEDTVYRDRLFQIVAFSEQGLTVAEKEELKTKIVQILDSTKHESKKLTVQSRGVTFDSKYEGLANISSGPSYVKATIPFRVSPYGERSFSETVEGSGLINNTDGDSPLGVKNIISGPISYPSFTMGQVTYTWNSTLPDGYTLVIDHALLTCYTIDLSGKKQNAMKYLSGKFQKVPKGKSILISARGDMEKQLKTEYAVKVLW